MKTKTPETIEAGRRGGCTVGIVRNTPYEAHLHLAALEATGAKGTTPNSFGDSPNNAHWAAFDMYSKTSDEFKKVCASFGLYRGWYGVAGYPPNEGCTMVVAKYVREN